MPLSGDTKKDIPELLHRCKRGGFGNIKGKSFEVCRRSALAVAYSAKRRKGRKKRRSRR